ncbi:hypothetical protein HanRHA438_Chr09g0415541 [Helianthus annuus]|nr:hypothetical protein HanRHA438_Chr09g0415541 [Helianthus annuus]
MERSKRRLCEEVVENSPDRSLLQSLKAVESWVSIWWRKWRIGGEGEGQGVRMQKARLVCGNGVEDWREVHLVKGIRGTCTAQGYPIVVHITRANRV